VTPSAQARGSGTTETVVAPPAELARRCAAALAAEAGRAIAARGRFLLAIPGGSVAETFLPEWPGAEVDWARVELFWVDERAVPPDDPESNYALARRAGLDRLPLAPGRIHRLRGEAADLGAAADEGERALRAAAGDPPTIDCALVGVGPDGHVASLFPGARGLAERQRWLQPVADAPKPPPRRLTWTLAVFAHVDLLVVAAFGEAKAAAIAAALGGRAPELPLARVAALARRRLLLLDVGAGSRWRALSEKIDGAAPDG
jgi:6-phosphogluconolactonase